MTNDSAAQRFERIEKLFEQVADIPPGERTALLHALCAGDAALRSEVLSLIDHDRESQIATGGAARLAVEPLDEMGAGTVVGRYQLIEEIGAGGMSRVYRARRTDAEFEQDVALKLMRAFSTAGEESARRFAIEQRVLGSLSHPNIARIFDSGLAAGQRPYLVMEYVDGDSILEYCERQRPGLDGRLRLFADVCDAVAHAHQRLIVHRDIKPSNILVDRDGHVKLLDFGIAKLLDSSLDGDATRTGLAMLTPQYAAPEQLTGGVITTATDVYALGLVLYELLTGSKALAMPTTSPAEQLRVVLNEQPQKPSTVATRAGDAGIASWAPRLRGDLDLVVAKALAKEPAERYSSCGALVADIRRWQRGLPIRAHAPSLGYLTRKFVRRNRIGVATAAIFLVVVAGFALALFSKHSEALQERDRAMSAEARTNSLNRFLADEVLGAATPARAQGRQVDVDDMLASATTAAARLENEPQLQAVVYRTLARTYRQLGNLEAAKTQAEAALAAFGSQAADTDPEYLKTVAEAAEIALVGGEPKTALGLATKVYEAQQATHGKTDLATIASQVLLGRVQTANADWAAAEQNLQAALTQLGSDDEAGPLRLTALAALVHQYTQLRRNRQAHDALVELLPLQRDRLGSGHPDTIASLVAFADIALRLYRTDEALAAAGEAHATAQAVYGEGHPQLLDSVVTLGRVLWRARRYTEAEQLFRDALRQFEERLDGEHPVVAILEGRLAVLLATSDRLIEAESLYLRALEGHIDLYGERHPDTIRVLKNYASLLSRRGKSDERAAVMARLAGIARSYAEDPGVDPVQLSDMADLLLSVEPEHLRDPELALAMASRAVSESRRQHPSPLLTMGDALLMLGRPAETIDLYEEAATLPDGLRILVIPRRLTSLYAASGETARAEAFLRRHLQRRQDAGVEGELLVAYSMFDLARFLVQQGRADEAESLARDAHQLFKASDSEALWLQARAQALLGATLSGQGRFAEAEETLLQAFEQVRNDSQTQKRVKREIAMWLASLYRDWEQPEQEQSWRALIASHEDAPTYSAW